MSVNSSFESMLAKSARPAQQVFRYLDTNGDGTGTKNLTGDYSSTEVFAHIEAEPGETLILHRMILKLRDTGPLSADEYGGITALSDGINVLVRNPSDADILDLTDGLPVQNNADWARLCYDIRLDSFGNGDDFVVVRWTFSNSGSPIVLEPGWKFGLLLSDDFSGLSGHFFQVQGYRGLGG